MTNNFSEILEKYPRSDLDKFGDWFELRLRIESGAGCFKISGTQEQVKGSVAFIINKFEKKGK